MRVNSPADSPAERSPLAEAVVGEALRRIESGGPLDDAAELRQAFHARATRADQVRERDWRLGERLGLPDALARWWRVRWRC